MVEWSPSVSTESLIKNKQEKCLFTLVKLEAFFVSLALEPQQALPLNSRQPVWEPPAPQVLTPTEDEEDCGDITLMIAKVLQTHSIWVFTFPSIFAFLSN